MVPGTGETRCVAWASPSSAATLSSTPRTLQQRFSSGRRLKCKTPQRRRRAQVIDCASGKQEQEQEQEQDDPPERPRELSKGEKYLKLLRDITDAETALSNPSGTKMSFEIVKFNEDGMAPRDRFVYVEERDCIGCTHCQTTAPGTFFMEDDFGRARVFDQTGDIEYVVEEAIDTCPVNCIYYVDWEDLVTLENLRKDQVINNKSRLVGGQDITSSKKHRTTTKVMDSGLMRCEDCPGRGCEDCPLYGVGQNPEYLRKKSTREAKKEERMKESRKRDRRRL